MNWIKKYWAELLVFGFIFAILMIDLNPDYTFVNKAADSIGYLYSARYLYPSYHTSPPLYLLMSHFFLMIPFGTDAWRMGLVSVLSTMGACVFILLTLKKLLPSSRFYPILGVLIYGTSALVISQSIIVNTYATTCALAVGAYYFAINKKWKLMGLMIGMGLAIHILMGMVFLIMLVAFKEYRKNWKALLITLSFGMFYLYIPLTNRTPYMWFPDPKQVNSVWAFIIDTIGTITFLIGKLSIWDLPKRILDTIGIVSISIGVITIIPIIYYFKGKRLTRNVLLWLILAPIVLFIGELDMNTYDYTMLAIPFLAIVSCLGLDALVERYGHRFAWRYVTLVVILGFGIFNANYFDIGRTLDPELSASKLYYQEFPKIPDKAIFMPNYAWEWEAIYKYNADYKKSIYPICKDILPSPIYRDKLREDGIIFSDSDNPNLSIGFKEVAQSIVALNDNVWTTVSTDPSTFGSVVVPANHDTSLIIGMDENIRKQVAEHPKVAWKPYAPYDILTTSIMISEWNVTLVSTWNVLFFTISGAIGVILSWLLFIRPNRKMINETLRDTISKS